MGNSERERLLDRYTRASAALFERVAELDRAGGCSDNPGFERAWSACQEANHLYAKFQRQVDEYLEDQLASESTSRQTVRPDSSDARASRPRPRSHGESATDA